MPLQILPQEENIGQTIGQGFSQGLNQLLGTLAQQKLQQFAQRQQSARTAAALEQYGISKEQAHAVSQMDPMMQQAYFKNYLQAPQNEAYAQAWSQLLGGGQQATIPQTGMQSLAQGQQLSVPGTGLPLTQNIPATQQGVPSLKGLSKEQLEKLGPLALQKQQFEKKEASRLGEQQWKKAQYYDERSKPEYEKAKGKAEAASENQMRFDRMKELIEKGTLSGPLWSSGFDTLSHGLWGVGINLTSLQGADSEEFRKLSNDMMKNVKEFVGNRVTNSELEMFLKTIPTLSNSDEGKIRIIHNLELFNKAHTEKYKIMNEIMEENDGMRPRNFETEVEKRYKPIQEAVSKEFKRSIQEDKYMADKMYKEQAKNRKKTEKIEDKGLLGNMFRGINLF